MAAAVDRDPMLGGDGKDGQVIEHHKGRREAQHAGHILHADLREGEEAKTQQRHKRQQPGIVGEHGCEAPEEHADELGGPGEGVDGRGAVDVMEDVGHFRATSRS